MDKMIYIAATGARGAMLRQDSVAQNLANVSTPGYRAAVAALQAVPLDPKGVGTKVFAVEGTAGADFTAGPVQRTGRALDIALTGDGWIAVQGRDGREAYTRNGGLEVSATGVLQTMAGQPVLGEGGPITVPPDSTVTIGSDGTVSAQNNGAPLTEVQVLGRIKLVNPPANQLARGDDGLFRTAQPAPADDGVRVAPGAIEGSNTNPVEAMVGMISAARQFEMHMKLLATAEQNSKSVSQLLQWGG